MALETLPQIGELRDDLRRQLGPAQWRALRRAIFEGDQETIFDILSRVYTAAGLSAYDLVGQYVADLPELAPDMIARIIDGAESFAEDAAVRAMGAPFLPLALQPAYPDILIDEGLAQGYEFGMAEAAEAADLQFKTWVRIYPVKEPRDWHAALEGWTMPADEPFVLPGGNNAGAEVEGPHDWDAIDDPGEWINCGHALVFTPNAAWADILH